MLITASWVDKIKERIGLQTYGDFLNFNPHLHAIAADGFFHDDGSFRSAPGFLLEDLEGIFQYEVLKICSGKGLVKPGQTASFTYPVKGVSADPGKIDLIIKTMAK